MRHIRPTFPNPYPDRPWRTLDGFVYESALILRREAKALTYRRDGNRDADYIVGETYRVSFEIDGVRQSLAVPRGMLTDLASVPRLARPLVDRVGPHLEASIVHDFLYIAWQDIAGRGARKADQRFADAVLVAGLRAARVNPFIRVVICLAVRTFGWLVYKTPNEDRYVELPEHG